MTEIPVHEINSPSSRTLADLTSIQADLSHVDAFLQHLEADPEPTIRGALFTAALICYRRCFATGVRNALTRDDIMSIGRNAHELHDYLIAQANKLAAHSVNPFEETKVGVLVADDEIIGTATFSAQLISLQPGDIKQFRDLVAEIRCLAVQPRIDPLHDATKTEARKRPIHDIKRGVILGYQAPPPEAAGKRRPKKAD